MTTNLADITDASNTKSVAGAQKAPSTPTAPGAHKEALLDEALVETFPASDPISPAYEARLEAQRAEHDEENTRIRHISTSVLSGLAGVAAVAAAIWLVRSLARHER